ncbi:MAG: HAD family hydrolase [Cytophagales bacterium]|nr:HAD family hydrolase [Cytophagales bacterium]
MKKNKCIFLDRDGVINKDYVDYVYTIEKFEFLEGVQEALQKFKEAGYLLIVITNQSGIVKGIYKEEDVLNVHNHIQSHTNNALDDIYYAPYHEKWTNSLTRKPNSLMLEKAIAKYNIDPAQSWMIGDKPRDLYPAVKLGMKTGIINYEKIPEATIEGDNLLEIYHKVMREVGE